MNSIDVFLTTHPMFITLNLLERKELRKYLDVYSCSNNTILVFEGELVNCSWLIVRGQFEELASLKQDDDPPWAELDTKQLAQQIVKRLYGPGDIIHKEAIAQQAYSLRTIRSTDEDSLVICLKPLNLIDFFYRFPQALKKLRPSNYKEQDILLNGLPINIWNFFNRQNKFSPRTKENIISHQYHSVIPLVLASFASIFLLIPVFIFMGSFQSYIFITIAVLLFFLGLYSRFRGNFILTKKNIKITEYGLLGWKNRVSSHPLEWIEKVEALYWPIISKLFNVGKLHLVIKGQSVYFKPIDKIKSCVNLIEESKTNIKNTGEAKRVKRNINRYKQWNNLQPKIISKWTQAAKSRFIKKSIKSLLIKESSLLSIAVLASLFSRSSPYFTALLAVPIFSILVTGTFLFIFWFRYYWELSEQALICHDRFNLVKKTLNIPINSIIDIVVENRGWIGHLLNYSNLVIRVRDSETKYNVRRVLNAQHLLDQIQALRRKQESLLQERILDSAQEDLEIYHRFNDTLKTNNVI